MMRKLATAALLMLASGCSLLFDSGSYVEIFPEGERPLLRYDFEGSGTGPIVSTGTDKLKLQLIGDAELASGALLLSQRGSDDSDDTYGHAKSEDAAITVSQQCAQVQSLTIAAWVTPTGTSPLEQLPARIFSIENRPKDTTNFSLGQGGRSGGLEEFVIRVGVSEQLEFPAVELTVGKPIFLFFTINRAGAYRFQLGERAPENGTKQKTSDTWTWDASRPLSLGTADNGERPWQGLIHHAEFFCRALDEDEQELLMNHTDPS